MVGVTINECTAHVRVNVPLIDANKLADIHAGSHPWMPKGGPRPATVHICAVVPISCFCTVHICVVPIHCFGKFKTESQHSNKRYSM